MSGTNSNDLPPARLPDPPSANSFSLEPSYFFHAYK